MKTLQLPSDPFAEKIILSACLCSIDALNECVDIMSPDSFFHGKNSLIFSACKKRYFENKEVDAYSIISDLGSIIDKNDVDEIISYRDYHDPYVKLGEYIEKVRNLSSLRKLYFASLAMNDETLHKEVSPDGLVDKYVLSYTEIVSDSIRKPRKVQDILSDFNNGLSFNDYVKERIERIKNGGSQYQGVQSYYPRLDETIGGFQDGSLHYIGARTSMGKTAFLLNLIQNIMKNEPGTNIAFLSLEMREETIAAKLLCMKALIQFSDYSNMRFTEEALERLYESQKLLSDNLILDGSPVDVSSMSSKIRRLVKVDKAKIIFIDYLTCIKATENLNSSHERVNQVSKALLSLAKELNVPIVCLAQLNRALTSRSDKSPTLADFRESGSIEEDADVCMLLHRPKYYDESNTDVFLHLIVAKNRLIGNLRKLKYEWSISEPGTYKELEKIEKIIPSQVSSPKKEYNNYVPSNNW